MSEKNNTPYLCHVFVCTHDRGGERKSCADREGAELRAVLKTEVAARGWRRWVRVTQSGCLGKCADGPNIMIYPQGIWYSKASLDDVDEILAAVKNIVKESAEGPQVE